MAGSTDEKAAAEPSEGFGVTLSGTDPHGETFVVELLRAYDADLAAVEAEVALARRRLSVVRAVLSSPQSRRRADDAAPER